MRFKNYKFLIMLQLLKSLYFYLRHGIDYRLPFLNDNYQDENEIKDMPLFIEYIWG